MLASYPPLEAYRRDVARRGVQRAFGADDGRWLATSVLLQRYVEAGPDERRRIGPELAEYLASDDELTVISAGLRVANELEEAGALHLANSWLSLLGRLVAPERALDVGRVVSHRARLARKLGAPETAHALYAQVESLGESNAEPELTARAWLGYATLAQSSGNNPENRRWCLAAALVADDTGCVEQSFNAHQGLMVAAGRDGDFDTAMVEGWRAFGFCEGIPEREAQILANIAQILYETGRHAAALRGFAAVVSRTTMPRVLLGVLGGAATAAAALGDRRVVTAAAERIERLAGSAWAFPTAQAFLDLSRAYDAVGATSVADEYRARGREIAVANGFDQLVQRADHPPVPVQRDATSIPRVQFGTAATRVISDIEVLDAPADLCAAA
ncbi:MAG: hypothetical protein JWM41_2241 [Gemmatimonadetes bacterium]|nr:hypothetical protein [Gemmatimonadota bacterium]